MAANPQIPPEPPYRQEKTEPANTGQTSFPWSVVAIIGTIIALGLIAYYFFR